MCIKLYEELNFNLSMAESISVSLVFVTVNKHTANNSQASLLRAGESQEQLMLVLPMQLAWKDV